MVKNDASFYIHDSLNQNQSSVAKESKAPLTSLLVQMVYEN